MNQIELQAKRVEALKLFNNTIVTSRLYPPEAPQVSTAVDRGYNGIKLFLRDHGELTFSMENEKPFLCGQLLEQEVLDSFSNLVVYRQLRLLGLTQLVLSSEMDRFAFGQLLAVFSASVDKIKKEGGGGEYITSLGLASYFPEESNASGEHAGGESRTSELRIRNLVSVRPELVACLFDKDSRPVIEAELANKMAQTEMAIDILAASVAHILQDIQKKKIFAASKYFPLMLKKAETLIALSDRKEVAFGLAKVMVESLKEPALCVLTVQEYPDGFGSTFSEGLLSSISKEKFAGVIVLLRERLVKARRTRGAKSPQVQFLGKVLMLLLNSNKGKHFLSAEKARTIIDEGERERKKRRLEAGIKGFVQGNISVLKNEELVTYLPELISQIQRSSGDADVSVLLKGMASYLQEASAEGRGTLLKSMVTVGENLIADGQWAHIDLILKPLTEEIRRGNSDDALIEAIVTYLQHVMQESWQEGDNDRGDSIQILFYQIRSGQTTRPDSIKAIVARVQDKGIRRANLPPLLAQSLAEPKNKKLGLRLVYQGPVALRFLVESLITSENAPDRLRIIDLLTQIPDFLPSVVRERLQEHMPWYSKRNLIKLLGETGSEEDAKILLPYLRHDDFRVQRETFLALYKIGGKNRKQLLLKALDESSELLRIQIVAALANFCDPEVAEKLVELLESHEQFSENNRDELLLQLLETLGRCPCPPAQKGVNAFLQTKGQRSTKKIPDHIWTAAENALKLLQNELQATRKKHVQASKLRKNALKQAAKIKRIVPSHSVITGLPEEQAVRTLLSRGDKTAAVQKILHLIEKVARQKQFMQAQKLREWLIEIDSTALGQILHAAEVIQQEKFAAIDKNHLEIWSGLYDVMTTEEFTAVYHALQHRELVNEEVVISQGALQGGLFLINSGKVKLYFDDQGTEVFVKTMGRGEIFGGEAFFEASVSTISVATVEKSQLSVLQLDTLRELTSDFPGIEAKLYSFCKKSESIEDFIKESSNDRRSHKRYRISGRVVTTLVDNMGRNLGTDFKIELCNISLGGLSFLVRISQKVNGRLLLGRKLQVQFPAADKTCEGVTVVGDILSVKNTYAVGNDYSLHMKFDPPLDQTQLHDIVKAMQQELPVVE